MLERVTKTLALTSALLIVALQIAFHPDGTSIVRALAALALIAGWLAAHSSRQSIKAFWIFVAPLAPAALRILTHREGPILDLIWMAGLTGALVRSVSWTTWTFPRGWSVLLGGWALALSLGWPIIVLREVNFDLRVLRDMGTINSWALLAAPQVVAWTLHVALTQLLGLLWFDWVRGQLLAEPDKTPRAVHALWIGATLASVVALYQGTIDLAFLNTPAWVALGRATGTMLDANAYGVTAAIAGPVAFLALRRRAFLQLATLGMVVLFVNFAGMWMSGSRTALLCATGGVAGVAAGLWSGRAAVRRLVAIAAVAAAALIAVLVLTGVALGPLGRLAERPAESRGLIDSLVNRGGYGTIANIMLEEFPLTGVGVGGYHVIAPDYWRVMTDRRLPFDNAQNWWRHVAAEFGLLGALPVLLWSAIIASLVFAGRPRPGRRGTAAAVRGVLGGIGACSLLGMPTQTPLVLLTFFLFAAWLSVLVEQPDLPVLARHEGAGWVVVTAMALAYAAGHVVLAQGPLSVGARAQRSHRDYIVGAYPAEQMPNGEEFRWTGREARLMLQARSPWVLVRFWMHHPDIAKSPVQFTIEGRCGVIYNGMVASQEPFSVGVTLPPHEQEFEAVVRVSRTWQPARFGEPDPRDLGAAVSVRFADEPGAVEGQDAAVHLPACANGR